VSAADVTAAHDQSFDASSLFSVSDVENDAITAYQLYDATATASSGHWVVNGVEQGANAAIDVTSGQLSQTSFVANYGADDLSIRANDGTGWGAWTEFHVTAPANQSPVVSGGDVNLALNLIVAASTLFSAADAEHDAIMVYQLKDTNATATSAHWALNGIEQSANQAITVLAADLNEATLVAASAPDSDMLWMRANDGTSWSDWHSLSAVSHA
jgi:hypothetical protein